MLVRNRNERMNTEDSNEWMLETPEPEPRRRRTRVWLKIAGASAMLLAVLGAVFVVGTNISAAQASSTNPAAFVLGNGNVNLAQTGGHGPNGPMYRGPGMRGGPNLTISSVQASTIQAKTPNGTVVTITTTASTQYTREGQSVSRSALKAGDEIHVAGQRQSNGSITATRVDIELPHAGGTVAAVSNGTITVKDRQGSRVIHTSASTTFIQAGQKVSLSAITTGDVVMAEGTLNADGSLNAQSVMIMTPRAGGTITKIAGNAITVQTPRGTQTINVTGSTKYMQVQFGANGPTRTTTSLSALKTGMHIMATGTRNSDGSFTATEVDVMTGNPPAHGQFHGGWRQGGTWGQPPAGTQTPGTQAAAPAE